MAAEGWSRRGLAAALGPALLSACAPGRGRRVISVNLLDTEPKPKPPAGPDAVARLEAAFDDAKRMVVPVYINGHGPFGFEVDTGANRSVVATEVAALCSLPSAGKAAAPGNDGVVPAR